MFRFFDTSFEASVLNVTSLGIPIHDQFSMPWLVSMPWPWRYMAPSIVPLMRCSCPVPLAEKHPQRLMFPPPWLTVFLGSWAAFLLLKTWRVELMPKSLILVSSDHNTFTQFSSESLANRRAFLNRGILPVAPHCRTMIKGAWLDPHLGGRDGWV